MLKSIGGLGLAALLLAACSQGETAAPPEPPQPEWPVPPSPELPITAAKAREIVGDLPLPCVAYASRRVVKATCDERQNKTVDHEALRTELRDLRWTLQQTTPEAAATACNAKLAELNKWAVPGVCWDLWKS